MVNDNNETSRRDREIQRDLEIAERVHRSMLPSPVRHPNIDIDVRYIPVEKVGGDYCQVLFPDNDCCCVTLCDVTGHGFGPALLATRFSSEVRRLVVEQQTPAEIVQHVNAFVFDHFSGTELLISFFCAQFDFHQMVLTYSGAGHPGPLLIPRASGSEQIVALNSQNLLLGVERDFSAFRPDERVEVKSGDRVIFYTDGITETTDPQGTPLGVDGLIKMATVTCANPIFETADCYLDRLAEFRKGTQKDDLTLLVSEVK